MSKPVKHGTGWRIRWIDGEGRRRSETYLKHGDAVKALARHQVEAQRVKREGPVQRQDHTLNELADDWLRLRGYRKRSKKTDASLLKVHLRPFFGGMRIRDIGPREVEEFKASRQHLHPNSANHALALLRTLLGYAQDVGWLDRLPKIEKFKIHATEYSYLRTPDEVRKFLAAAHEERPPVFIVYLTALQTGMRCGELCGLKWPDVDFDKRMITVRCSYEGPTKNGEIRYVPILDGLLRELKMWKLEGPRTDAGWVFPNHGGRMHTRCNRIFQETLQRVLVRAGLPRDHISFHDLRHTFASFWMMSHGDRFRLQRVLGHKEARMTERYAHLTPDVFAQDYGKLAGLTLGQGFVAQLREVAGGKAPVVWPGKKVAGEE